LKRIVEVVVRVGFALADRSQRRIPRSFLLEMIKERDEEIG
jgi:hypothetical protein